MIFMNVYLDNAATTKPCKEAIEAINFSLTENYGNPSSLHSFGLKAQLAVDEARKIIASALSCDAQNIYFTSGATESNNMALRGIAGAYGKRKPKIITTTVEHASVKETVADLENKGFEIVRISPDENGEINPADIVNAADENTCLISMMLVNNENGYILPVAKTFKAVKRRFPDIITHCDCVQGFMKLPVKCAELNADIISLSAHKIHGAKGVGALYIRKGVRLTPIITGGKQEKGIRSGTESVPLITAFGAAVKKLEPTISARYEKASELKAYLLDKLKKLDGGEITYNSGENCSPYIINVSFEGIRSEIMLHFLEEKGIYVSSGSACSKGAKSGVLEELGVSAKNADSAIRVSITAETTEEELDLFAQAVSEAQKKIMKSK